jgi:glycosyltransferase involved in cell wall biosynthesis
MNKRSYPKVSVVMSVYNGEKYLCEAIDSILNQTFENFEFLIVNDGSTDRTLEILQSYRDPRIKVINNERNIGLTASLNKGLKIAKGEYVARMDADDVSFPHRLEQQKAFLDRNPRVAMVGSWAEVIDESGKTQETWRVLTSSHLLKR